MCTINFPCNWNYFDQLQHCYVVSPNYKLAWHNKCIPLSASYNEQWTISMKSRLGAWSENGDNRVIYRNELRSTSVRVEFPRNLSNFLVSINLWCYIQSFGGLWWYPSVAPYALRLLMVRIRYRGGFQEELYLLPCMDDGDYTGHFYRRNWQYIYMRKLWTIKDGLIYSLINLLKFDPVLRWYIERCRLKCIRKYKVLFKGPCEFIFFFFFQVQPQIVIN